MLKLIKSIGFSKPLQTIFINCKRDNLNIFQLHSPEAIWVGSVIACGKWGWKKCQHQMFFIKFNKIFSVLFHCVQVCCNSNIYNHSL